MLRRKPKADAPLWDPSRWWDHPGGKEERRRRAELRAEWISDFPVPALTRQQRRWSIVLVTVVALLLTVPVIGRTTGTFQVVPVLSGSMAPDMRRGDIAIVVPVAAEAVRPGDVILFDHPQIPDRPVIHRVIEVIDDTDGLRYRTRGDANPAPDPWEVNSQARGEMHRRVWTIPMVGLVLLWARTGFARLLVVAVMLFVAAGFVAGTVRDRQPYQGAHTKGTSGPSPAWSPPSSTAARPLFPGGSPMAADTTKPKSALTALTSKAKELADDVRDVDDDTPEADLTRLAVTGIVVVLIGLVVLWNVTGLIGLGVGGLLTVGGLGILGVVGRQSWKNVTS